MAVEFALLLPVLLLIVFGIIDFGRAYNAQITLTQAAREGVRAGAITGSGSDGVNAAQTAIASTALSGGGFSASMSNCAPDTVAVMRTSYQFSYATPISGVMRLVGANSLTSPITLTSEARMRCNG